MKIKPLIPALLISVIAIGAGVYGYRSSLPRVWETPTPVTPGATVSIWGEGFSPDDNTVTIGRTAIQELPSRPAVFGGKESPEYAKGSVISFTVPSLPDGTYALFVTTSKGKSNTEWIVIAGVPPPSVLPGQSSPEIRAD
ncbi:MAG: hypothetical protein WDN10_04790 [bacterium]